MFTSSIDKKLLSLKVNILKPFGAKLASQISVVALPVIAISALSLSGLGSAQGNIQITGVVTDQSNNELQNASVYVTDPGTSTVDYGPVLTATNGSYTLSVDPGTYDFHVDPPSGTEAGSYVQDNLTISSNQTINAQLPALSTLSGMVTDSNNNAASGVNLMLQNGPTPSSVYSDSNGHYSTTVEPGTYALDVSSGGYGGTNLGGPNFSFLLTPRHAGIAETVKEHSRAMYTAKPLEPKISKPESKPKTKSKPKRRQAAAASSAAS